MKEEFICYLWENRLLERNLQTIKGEEITVLFVGNRNTNSGADFINARIKIGNTLWAGQIEIHVFASDWFKHGHHYDEAYNNVILHIVYEYDTDKLNIPTLVIKDKFDLSLYENYKSFVRSKRWIPCEKLIIGIQQFTLLSWLDRMLVEHLESECKEICLNLAKTHNNWEEVFYQRLIRYCGPKVNNDAFEQLSRFVPLKFLLKHIDNKLQVEAMLFGCAGFLEQNFTDIYPSLLKREFLMLKSKFNLKVMPLSCWKFLRLRPSNFPTIRIAQLSEIIHKTRTLFSKIRESENIDEIRELFNIKPNDYWDFHYKFDKKSKTLKKKILGNNAIDILIINAVIPTLFYYGQYHKLQDFKDKAVILLEKIDAEDNIIIRNYEKIGIWAYNAYQTQALLYMYTNYCIKRRCLECRLFYVLFNGWK